MTTGGLVAAPVRRWRPVAARAGGGRRGVLPGGRADRWPQRRVQVSGWSAPPALGVPRNRRRTSCPGSVGRGPVVPRGTRSRRPGRTWPILGTRAVLDGEEWVINGRRPGPPRAKLANWIFVLTHVPTPRLRTQGNHLPSWFRWISRGGGAPHPYADRAFGVQRDVLHRSTNRQGQCRRGRKRRLGGGHDPARL